MVNNVVILNFSGRKEGNCFAIAQYLSNHHAKPNVRSYHINQEFGTCGGCDYECLKPGVRCPNVTKFQEEVMDAICQSDLVYYIVPNYCGLPCANYFAFNERSTGYFNMDRALMAKSQSIRKKFIIVSNTETDSFVQAMRMQAGKDPEMLYMKTGKYGKKSIAGDILESEEAKADLEKFLALD